MIAFIVALLLQAPAPDAGVVSGIVRDSNGGVVAGATVIVRSAAGGDRQALSGPDGRFNLTTSDTGEVVLIVRAAGFGEKRQSLTSGATRRDLDVVLSPATVFETVTVTPSRGEQRMGDVPASVSILGREEIRRSPAVVADDVLRQVPTFSLFRRTSSISSHPTTQGVSLRGIGPSGVSRTLVLLDGVPFNDPFGGWVYWTRLPMERASRVEIVDGSSSSLYGNYAMGGVINVVTSSPERRTLALRTQYGNLNTPKLDVAASDVWGKLGVSVDAGMFSTDGFPVVVAVNPAGVPERGQVDNDVTVDFRNFNVKLDYDPTGRIHTFFRTGYFREERNNGKHSTIDGTPEANNTTWKTVSGGVRMRLPDTSELQANVFLDFGDFHSSFLAVPATTPPRNIGRMTLNQAVPSTGVGWTTQWSRTFAGNQVFTAGADGRWVDGDSEEDGLDAVTGTTVTLRRVSGGTQRSFGAFLQDIYKPIAELTLTFSARVDSFRNYDGHNLEHNVPSGTPTAGNAPSFPERSDTVVSPRVGALYRLTPRVNIWGDFAWGFRAPTLNELYRQFRVGQVVTLANHQLGPERLVGGEAGVSIAPLPNLTVRSTWYDNRVTDPVSNVTISTVGATVTQQRQNLGKTRVTGLQTDAEYRAGIFWRFAGGYLYNRARVTENPANPALVDKYLPQVPAHRGSVQVSYANPKYATVAFELLAIGRQFDDDQNVRAVPGYSYPGLPKYALIGINAERAIGPRFDVFFGVQNLLDQAYFVGTLPTTTGSPRMITGGIRVRLTGR